MISLGSLEHICEEASRLVFESKSICIPNEATDTKGVVNWLIVYNSPT
jgi:hypothetical protein